jgi:hypothetical protein
VYVSGGVPNENRCALWDTSLANTCTSSHASAACSILLLDVAQTLLERNDGRALEDLVASQECINILNERSTFSRIAQEMLDDIGSLNDDLSTLLHGENAITRSVMA